jgi:hypothetical protein
MTEALKRLVAFYEKRASVVLWLALALTVVSALAASNLRVDSDLGRLLPDDAPSVAGLRTLESSYGKTIDRFTLIVEGDDEAKNVAALEDLRERVVGLERVVKAEIQQPAGFFETNRLLYMDTADAEEVVSRVEKRIKFEKKRANPLYVDLGLKPPSVDMSDIEAKYDDRHGSGERYFKSDDGTKYLLLMELDFPASNLDGTEAFLPPLREIIDEVERAHPAADVHMAGRYYKRIEQKWVTERDLTKGTIIALAVILVFLLVYFRGLVTPLIVSIPLLAGTIWAFAFTYLMFDTLNVITGFGGTVLLGLGIDYGIHLVTRYQEERRTREVSESIVEAFDHAGRASAYAGLTTMIAFGTMSASSFRAFHEFGTLALGGLALVLLAYLTVLPCLLIKTSGTRLDVGALPEEKVAGRRITAPLIKRARVAALGLALVGAPIIYVGLGQLGFEYDFHELMPEGLESIEVDALTLEVPSMWFSPSIVLTEDRAHAEAVAAEIRKRAEENERFKGLMKQVLTPYDLLPEDQEAKLELLADLEKKLDRLPSKVMKNNEDFKTFNDEVKGVTEGGVITTATLPEDIAGRFRREDAPDKPLVFAFPAVPISDARVATFYADTLRDLPPGAGGEPAGAISEEAVYSDILSFVERDGTWMVTVTTIGILLIVIFAFRSARNVLVTIVALSLGGGMAVGLMGLTGVTINFVNVVVFPIWLGLGVDAVFHLMGRSESDPNDLDGYIHTVSAVFAAFATTAIGFGGMSFSSHRGLASLGMAAVIGLACLFVTAVVIQLAFWRTRSIDGEG